MRSGRLSRRELLVAWPGLLIVGALVFAPHIRHGGLYFDDWANGAGTLYPPGGAGIGNALSYFWKLTLYRPVLVVYVPLTFWVLGTHAALQLAWATVLAVAIACLLYGILRTLSVPPAHSWLIAALTIAYPWFDSTRLWAAASQASVSITLVLAGAWVALYGLERSSRRLHACAVVLYLLSVLAYEVAIPLILAMGLIYTLRAGWRAARWRWAADIVAAALGATWVGSHEAHRSVGASGYLSHFKQIVTGGEEILGRSLIALGEVPRTTLALFVMLAIVITGVAALIVRGHRMSGTAGFGLREWLLVTGAGLAFTVLGWLMFIPADPYYTPNIYGIANRVNALAGFGLVILVYGLFGIVGSLVGRIGKSSLALGSTVTLVLGVLLGATYVRVLERHTRYWNAAYTAEQAGIREIKKKFPKLAPGTTIFTSNYPASETFGVPIFDANYDLKGLVQLTYHSTAVSAYPVLPGLTLTCLRDGIALKGTGGAPGVTSYGHARLLNLAIGSVADPTNQRSCLGVVGRFTPGPSSIYTGY